ncbi:copper resistance CopC family protein [Geomicrobium sediminis]|uniref:Methionine-rich copper-binding protein CopC n=1 Tax=Geomicrobium sediminis TaxID=1347788 RepID=A0ABS2PAA1_9BACL|nr:copper resistance protein CopC [Geomicrobium sediminis]MBM7632237.1 methionine-rich copper-binding protein CopC [Geomicrobium sediminis]
MKKTKQLLAGLLVVMGSAAMATTTYAHSYVDESIPADGETVEEPVETLTLHFDAGIEPATTVTITDQDGEEFAVQEENVEGDDFIVELEESLPSGDYNVFWQALGADGHGTEGEFNFTVDAPEEEVVEEEEVTEEDATDEDAIEEAVEEDDGAEENVSETADEDTSDNNTGLIVGIVAGIVVLGAVVFLISRRNRS